jgi:hypothetical protein
MNNSFDNDTKERNVVYGCAIHGRQLAYSADYKDIHKFLQINFDNETKEIKRFLESFILMDKNTKEILSEKFKFDVIHMQSSLKLCYNDREKKLFYWCKAFQAVTASELLEVLEENKLMEEKAKAKYLNEVNKYSTDDQVYQIYTEYSREEMERNTKMINLAEKEEKVKKLEDTYKKHQEELLKNQKEFAKNQKDFEKNQKDFEKMQDKLKQNQKDLEERKNNLITQGKQENQIEIIKNAINMRLSLEDIAKLTGLSIEEINEILKN